LKNLFINLFSVAFCLVLVGKPVLAKQQKHHHSLMGTHGMVIFGDEQKGFFASHLPLYFSPHDYQIIYKVEVSDSIDLISALDKGMVTVLPAKFDLTRLINKEQFAVSAQFFQGHFERGGSLMAKAQLVFDKPILIKPVQSKLKRETSLYYLEPVDENWGLAVHQIESSPSFDVISWISRTQQPRVFRQLETSNLLKCEKPTSLQHADVVMQLNSCGLADPVYLETQDFK